MLRLFPSCLFLRRTFNTVAEAQAIHDALPLSGPGTPPRHLALLSCSNEEILEGLPQDQMDWALQVLTLTAPPLLQHRWPWLKNQLSTRLSADPRNTSLFLAGVVAKLRIKDRLKQRDFKSQYLKDFLEMQAKRLAEIPVSSNLDAVTNAIYWLSVGSSERALKELNQRKITDEAEYFLLIRGLFSASFAPKTLHLFFERVFKNQDVPKLAAVATLFSDANLKVVTALLSSVESEKFLETILRYLEYLQPHMDSIKLFHTLQQLELPEDVLRQVCLECHHNSQDEILLSVLLTCTDSFLDVSSHLTSPSLSPEDQLMAVCQRYLKSPLLRHFLQKISRRDFAPGNRSLLEYVTALLEQGFLEAEDLSALAMLLTPDQRASLAKTCVESGRHTVILGPLLEASWKQEEEVNVMKHLINQCLPVSLSTSDYLDDLFTFAFPVLPGQTVLELSRSLFDGGVLSDYQLSLWTVYGHSSSGNADLARTMFEEYYENEESVYFSGSDLQNLAVLCPEMESEVRKRMDVLAAQHDRLSEIIESRELEALLSYPHFSVALLHERQLLLRILRGFSLHTALHTLSLAGSTSAGLFELLRQAESSPGTWYRYTVRYLFPILPPPLKSYSEEDAKRKWEDKFSTQMYFFSFCSTQGYCEEVRESLLAGGWSEMQVARCCLTYYLTTGDQAVAQALLEHGGLKEIDMALLERVMEMDKSGKSSFPESINQVNEYETGVEDRLMGMTMERDCTSEATVTQCPDQDREDDVLEKLSGSNISGC